MRILRGDNPQLPAELQGEMTVRITERIVANGKPRDIGEVLTMSKMNAMELIHMKRAERYIEAPTLRSL